MAMRAKWRRVGRPLLKGLGALVLVPLLYFLAVAIGGTLTANADWREPDEGVTLFIRTNGVHTWIMVPTVTAEMDWRPLAPASHIKEPRLAGTYLAFGFGHREDRKSTRLNSSHLCATRMPSSACKTTNNSY